MYISCISYKTLIDNKQFRIHKLRWKNIQISTFNNKFLMKYCMQFLVKVANRQICLISQDNLNSQLFFSAFRF